MTPLIDVLQFSGNKSFREWFIIHCSMVYCWFASVAFVEKRWEHVMLLNEPTTHGLPDSHSPPIDDQ